MRNNAHDITAPPFYLPQFEQSYRYIIDDYPIVPHEIAIFIPCAVRKPYSQSPSHRLFHKIFNEVFQDKGKYHVVIFGTCGVVPSELELMYPYAHYHYMLGNVKDQRLKDDFLHIETRRIAEYLEKTRFTYDKRIAYCIGLFRTTLEMAVSETQIPVEIYPTHLMIDMLYDADCPFPEGSLSMQAYIDEFRAALVRVRED
ncbi:MAG TPA: DUF5591 domain-containing protein [Methanocorpusculum sp.]|nr:DUF5591 domain-containing protein [Methanocorpusculum sp.]HJK02380.1 DUF5591 domain-containing protein [Methanocorpusculum sp.]